MNRGLKLLAALSISGLVFAAPVRAEDPAPKEGGDKKQAPEGGRKREGGQRGPAERLQMIIDQLDLTADQKKEAEPIVQETREAVQKIMQDQTIEPKDKRAKAQEAVKAGQEKLGAVLTAEQKEKLAKLQAERREGGAKQGPREGEGGAKTGPRDGEGGAKQGPRDGEGGGKKGPRDGEGGARKREAK